MKNFFKDWNYKKHAKFVTGVYLALYAIDMTAGYFICRKCLDKIQETEEGYGCTSHLEEKEQI